LTNTRSTELDCDGLITIGEVLKRLVAKYGDKFSDTVLEMDGEDDHMDIKRSFNVYLNGMNIKNLRGIKTEVRGNDEIIILSWVSGG